MNELSVLMSLYHAEHPSNLNQCLDSLMKQTYQASEIILVLDGPIGDSLESVVQKWSQLLPISVVRLSSNVGLGKALSIGLKHCSNELVARMDTDDLCLPKRFELQVEMFKSDPYLSICGSNINEFEGEIDNIISHRKLPVTHSDILAFCPKANPFNHMTVMYKKTDVLKSGNYMDMPWMEDWYLWLRMLSSGCKGANIPESLVLARTGRAMIERRAGIKYIRSEWELTKIKISLSLVSRINGLIIFFVRSLPRLLPKRVLMKLYLFSRKRNA